MIRAGLAIAAALLLLVSLVVATFFDAGWAYAVAAVLFFVFYVLRDSFLRGP